MTPGATRPLLALLFPQRAERLFTRFKTMTTTIALILAILFLPVLVLLWATESREQRVRRWKQNGWSQQRMADRLGCSRTTVRRLLVA